MSRALRFLDFWEVSDSARDVLSESTPMRDSAYQARSRLIASNYIPKDYVVEVSLMTRFFLILMLTPRHPETEFNALEGSAKHQSSSIT